MKKIIALGLVSSPAVAFAIRDSQELITSFSYYLRAAANLLVGAAVVFFLWQVFNYVKSGGDAEGKTEGRTKIISGIIGIAVMVSLWGLVGFLTDSADLDTRAIRAPEIRI